MTYSFRDLIQEPLRTRRDVYSSDQPNKAMMLSSFA